MAYGVGRHSTNSSEGIDNMKYRVSPKRRLISGLHVLKQLMEEEKSLDASRAYQQEIAKKSAELVALEIAAYRKKYKLLPNLLRKNQSSLY